MLGFEESEYNQALSKTINYIMNELNKIDSSKWYDSVEELFSIDSENGVANWLEEFNSDSSINTGIKNLFSILSQELTNTLNDKSLAVNQDYSDTNNLSTSPNNTNINDSNVDDVLEGLADYEALINLGQGSC